MSVTIQEVAEAAGVSKATVSKVLHKSYSISQETCDRVNAVIKELGYQPNRRAQSFATGATKTILFLAEMQHGVGFDNPHLFEIMAGVENALSEKGYGLIVQHSTAVELLRHFDELLQGSYVDGVILHASVVSKDVAICLAHTELPYIVVGAPDFSNQLCWIDTNNSVAGQIAVTHLRRNGYDRIAFIGGPKEDTISAHRLNGALATLNEKIPAGYLREGPPTSEGGAAAARALLALPMQPNAVICANQYIAFGCVNELKVSGIRIPEDMAVITFDDFPFSKIIEPQLSVVNLDMFDMGGTGCESCSEANPDTAVSCTISNNIADINRTTINKETAVKPESIKQDIKIRKYSNLFEPYDGRSAVIRFFLLKIACVC